MQSELDPKDYDAADSEVWRQYLPHQTRYTRKLKYSDAALLRRNTARLRAITSARRHSKSTQTLPCRGRIAPRYFIGGLKSLVRRGQTALKHRACLRA
jgi:hypothetical protein